jgi:hypothetical protein
LSYENEQYKHMKAVMPKLGQTIETPAGSGQVIALQLMKETVTVRLESDGLEMIFRGEELGLSKPAPSPAQDVETLGRGESEAAEDVEADETVAVTGPAPSRRRRRRRGGRRGSSSADGAS